jgi:hypothetical protein
MALREKYIHMLFEFLAVIILVPFFISLLYKYNFDIYDKLMIKLIIIITILVDGYLFFSWFF